MRDEFTLPSDIEAEKDLLGALMLADGAEAIPIVTDIISVEDFYRPEHRIIYKAILDTYDKQQSTFPQFVSAELKRIGKLEAVNPTYFLAIVGQGFTTAYARTWAETIKEKAKFRQIITLADNLKYRAQSDPAATVEDLMTDVNNLLLKVDTGSRTTFEAAGNLMATAYERIDELSKTKGLTGVTSGFMDLDKITNGLQNSDLILLAARPSMGKTALALNIAHGAARAQKVVAVFSLEMSTRQLAIRLLSALSRTPASKINSGNVTLEERSHLLNAIEHVEKLPLYIDDTNGTTVASMRIALRRFKQEHGLDLIIVDYLQLMRGKGENRVQEISEISRGLKALAKEFNVPVLALSQLSRNVEMRAEKRPQLSDLRDSGSLEQDADIVMFLYRGEYYERDADNENIAELIIAKNRNGPTAKIPMYFDKATMRFGDLIREVER